MPAWIPTFLFDCFHIHSLLCVYIYTYMHTYIGSLPPPSTFIKSGVGVDRAVIYLQLPGGGLTRDIHVHTS